VQLQQVADDLIMTVIDAMKDVAWDARVSHQVAAIRNEHCWSRSAIPMGLPRGQADPDLQCFFYHQT